MIGRRGFLKALGIGAAAPAILPAAAIPAAESMLGTGGMAGAIGGLGMANAMPWYRDPVALGKAILKRKWISKTMPEWYTDNKSYDDLRMERIESGVTCMRSWSQSAKHRILTERRRKAELDDWVREPSKMLARSLVEGAHQDMGVDNDPFPY